MKVSYSTIILHILTACSNCVKEETYSRVIMRVIKGQHQQNETSQSYRLFSQKMIKSKVYLLFGACTFIALDLTYFAQ